MHYENGRLVKGIRKQGTRVLSTCCITPLQIEIGKLLAEGLDEKEIAARLNKSHGTIKNHKMYAFEKTDSRSSAQYVYKLVKAGLIVLLIGIISCSSQKRGCGDQEHYRHQFRAYRVIRIDSLHPGFLVTVRSMNNFYKIKCDCNCLPDSVKIGSMIRI